MADNKKGRVNPDFLLRNMLGREIKSTENSNDKIAKEDNGEVELTLPEVNLELISTVEKKETEENQSKIEVRPGRKPGLQKKQISIYIEPEMDRKLAIQSVYKIKGNDKSAIAAMGIEIALELTNETYFKLQDKAEKAGKNIGQICEEVLSKKL